MSTKRQPREAPWHILPDAVRIPVQTALNRYAVEHPGKVCRIAELGFDPELLAMISKSFQRGRWIGPKDAGGVKIWRDQP